MGFFDLFRNNTDTLSENEFDSSNTAVSDLVQYVRDTVWNSNVESESVAENFSIPDLMYFGMIGTTSAILGEGATVMPQDILPDWMVSSFTGGNYETVILDQPLTVYRAYGGQVGAEGSYWTTAKPGDPMEAKLNNAILQIWPEDLENSKMNSRQYVDTMTLPKGTKINIGTSASQTSITGQELPGGQTQVVLEQDFFENHPDIERTTETLDYKSGYNEFSKRADLIAEEAANDVTVVVEEEEEEEKKEVVEKVDVKVDEKVDVDVKVDEEKGETVVEETTSTEVETNIETTETEENGMEL